MDAITGKMREHGDLKTAKKGKISPTRRCLCELVDSAHNFIAFLGGVMIVMMIKQRIIYMIYHQFVQFYGCAHREMFMIDH